MLCLALTAFPAWPLAAETAWFAGLGDLPGGEVYSNAKGVSADHRVVVGFSVSRGTSENGREAFIWTREEGMVGLGDLDGIYGAFSEALDVSADGSVVVGFVGSFDSLTERPFRWTKDGGMAVLRFPDGSVPAGFARAVSLDGNVVVGTVHQDRMEAFRWTPENGIIGLGGLGYPSFPNISPDGMGSSVSEDGSIVVGSVRSALDPAYREIFRWILTGGQFGQITGLGLIGQGDTEPVAQAVSRDGSVVVGFDSVVIDGIRGNGAILWTQSDGFRPMWTSPAGFASSFAADVTGDGTQIVGSYTEGGDFIYHAYLWDEANGRRDIRAMLVEDYGLADSLEGWTLSQANAISPDGLMIVGRGRNPAGEVEAFAAYLGEPVVKAEVPVIASQPASQVSESGRPVTFRVEVEPAAGPGLTYQWKLNGSAIHGATGPALTLPMVQRFQAGQYTVEVTNGPHTVTSTAATLTAETPPPSGARLLNLSTRANLQTENSLILPGFVIEGSGTKRLLLRGVGASLRLPPFDLDSALGDTWLMVGRKEEIFEGGGVFSSIERNDDLETSANRAAILEASMQVGAFPLTDERDSAILIDLPAGVYSGWVASGGGDHPTGVALVEIYDADEAESSSVLTNLSTRGHIASGSEVLIPGFVVSSEGPLTLLLRVVGPTLATAPFDLADANPDPRLSLFGVASDGASPLLFTNEDWEQQPDAAYTAEVAGQVGAFALRSGGKDAAIVLTLAPGAYTVVGSSASGLDEGLALVELYVVPPEIVQ